MSRGEVPAIRGATPADAERIAALHAASWQSAYRGSLSDAFLDGPVLSDRRAVWAERFGQPVPGQIVMLAEAGVRLGGLLGFICAFAAHGAATGSLVDNLHVAPDHKRRGIGRALMQAIAGPIEAAAPGLQVTLAVIEANHGARDFYARLGGEAVERFATFAPDGREVEVLRIRWASPAHLLAAASR